MHRAKLAWFLVALGLLCPRSARAEPWLGALDPFSLADREGVQAGDGGAPYGHAASSFFSLVAFRQTDFAGTREVGAMALLSFAFDRMAAAAASPASVGDPPPPAPAPPTNAPPLAPVRASAPPKAAPLVLTPRLARAAVAAAFRVAGLGTNDATLDAMVERARLSALLPETRLRAMHASKDEDHAGTATDDTLYYGTTGANLWLEARLTWRLDRLLYAGDEPAFERIRLERQAARTRLAAHVLELLVQWQRALLDLSEAEAGEGGGGFVPASTEATLRTLEAEVALDVATGGWFTGNHGLRGRAPGPP